MKRSITILLCLLIAQFLIAAPQQNPGYKYLPDQLVVKLAKQASDVYSIPALSARISLAKGVGNAVKPLVETKKLKSPDKAREIGLDRIYTVQVTEQGDIHNLCQQLQLDPNVEWAEPVYLIPQDVVPNDEYYYLQQHLPQIFMPEAWDVAKGDSTVVIAIIDSGVDYLHYDLADRIWVNAGEFPNDVFPGLDSDGNGSIFLNELVNWSVSPLSDFNEDEKIDFFDLLTGHENNVFLDSIDNDGNGFVDDFLGWDWVTGVSGEEDGDASPREDGEVADNDPMDVNGHGTHCAGIAGAITNNGVGVAGVSWGCSIMSLRIGWLSNDGNGYGYSTWMSQAFIYAGDNGAKAANLSYGTSRAVLEGALYAFEHDVAIATSAGNESVIIGDALGTVPWALTVTAVDNYNIKTDYSNFGLDANIAAPGGTGLSEGIMSLKPGGFLVRKSGTSMASPVVAGVLGLVRSHFPEFTASDAYYQVVGSADNIDDLNPGYEGLLGGCVNGYRALTETVVPAPKISLDKVDFIDASGNNNGIADPGETVDIVFHIKNRWAPSSAATVKLLAENGEDRLTINTSQINLDTLYGIQDANYDHTNEKAPFQVTINSSLPPSMIPMYIVVENSVISDTFKFEIAVHPLMLFVADTDAEILPYYGELFNDLGIVYSYWLNNDTISADYLSKFPIVFWDSEWAFPSLAPEDRTALTSFLTNGGNLFVAGQDLAWDLADQTSTLNEWYDTGGESKTWMENYLYVDYVSDAGGSGPISPASTGSFFELSSFEFYLEERSAENQYPDEISPRTGAYTLLNYSNGSAAAVGNDEPYSTIFFSFGGLGAITDYDIRKETTKQIVNHFAKLEVTLGELKNTESVGPFTVSANVQTDNTLAITEIWYSVNEGSWQNLTMTDQGSGNYTVDIPAVTGDSDIEYFAFFKTSEGLYNTKSIFKFHSGIDNEAPLANALYNQDQSIDLSGVYSVAFALNDFVSVDTNNVKVHYSASTGFQDSVLIDHFDKNIWKGNIVLPSAAAEGANVDYHITYSDMAATKNFGRFPEIGELTITIGDSAMIDDFETDINRWINDDDVWSPITDSVMVYNGEGALITGNGSEYPQNRNTSIELHYPIDLSGRTAVWFSYYATLKFQSSSDSAFFEVKEGDGEWETLVIMASRSKSWARYDINLMPYCGPEHEPISMRFRFLTDEKPGSLNRWGLIVDDIYIIADRDFLAVDDELPVPDKFKLLSAYPNPFNATVNIPYSIPKMGEVSVCIYDVLGREVFNKNTKHSMPGYYNLYWNGKSNAGIVLTSGIYFINVQFGNKSETSKIMFLK